MLHRSTVTENAHVMILHVPSSAFNWSLFGPLYLTFLLKFEYCINFIKFLSCPFRKVVPFVKLVLSQEGRRAVDAYIFT